MVSELNSFASEFDEELLDLRSNPFEPGENDAGANVINVINEEGADVIRVITKEGADVIRVITKGEKESGLFLTMLVQVQSIA